MSHDPVSTRRLEAINRKGWDVAQKLQELKARKNVTLKDLLPEIGEDAREPPEVRLRRYLDTINAARQRLNQGTYGRCTACDKPFSDAELDELPWVDLCRPCAAQNR